MAGSALLDAQYLLEVAGVTSGMHVADFGVGKSGHLIFPAAKRVGEIGRVYGVDIVFESVKMLEGRRRQYLVHNLELVHGDIEAGNLLIPPGSLDRIFFIHTLPMTRQHEALLKECQRLLKDDGLLVVVDWHPDKFHPIAPAPEYRLYPHLADVLFLRAGCEVCGQFAPGNAHWGRIYRFV
jgi:ubiquinone/menaquinone biosynthesis C-methylase UbiE